MIVLDWRDRAHFAGTSSEPHLRRCRICRGLTPLRDDAGLPCHKVCAERELTRPGGAENHAGGRA